MPRRQPLPIDLEVKAAIEKLSATTRAKLMQFARRGVYRLLRAGETVAADEHEQLVHDAITDTLSLVVAWDRRLKMEAHLYSVINRRISNRIRAASRRVHLSTDVLNTDDDLDDARRQDEPERKLGRAQATRALCGALRERATGDAEVLSILDAYERDETDRRAVMATTGLALPEFVNARRRLDRLLATLPAEVRSVALAAMRDADLVEMVEITTETID